MQNNRWQDIRCDLTPSWDELRERRVLGRVLAEVREGKRTESTRRIRWIGVGAVAAAAAVLVLLSAPAAVDHAALPKESPAKVASRAISGESPKAAPVTPAEETPGTSTLRFADGSMAQLWADAQVVNTAQSREEVVIEQRAGRVRYEVPALEQRRFVVHATNVAITVLATVFEVEVSETEIEVRVQDGKVQLTQGDRRLSLHAGESFRLSRPAEPEPAAAASQAVEADSTRAQARGPSRRRRSHSRTAQKESKVATFQPAAEPQDAMAEGLHAADKARRAGDLSGAARVLQDLIAGHGSDARLPRASFTLGRVERSRGRHGQAARAFEACLHSDPQGPLAEDALAEAAVAWSAAGDLTRSRALANQYVARFNSSTHSARIRTLLR